MRIAIDARLTAYRTGGIAEYSRALVRELPPVADPQTQWLILEARRAAESLLAQNTDRISAATMLTPCHHRLERTALAIETARFRLDVLHSPDFIPPRRLPLIGVRRRIITVHDLNFLHYPQFQTADSLRYYAGQIRAAVREADHILADSEATKADLCDLLSVAPEKITVHPLGVDSAFRPLPAEQLASAQARLKLPSAYLLFVGTFEPRKNLPGLLNGYAGLIAQMPDAPPLLLVGRRGWLDAAIFEQIDALHLGERVIWRDDIADADRVALYNGALLLCLPAFYEGFGLPPLEAMACGVPVVVSDRSSLPEVVGTVGLYIDPDRPDSITAALSRALTDSAWRVTAKTAGIARAATFTWRRTAEITWQCYRQVLDG